jgi:hypothetical protein
MTTTDKNLKVAGFREIKLPPGDPAKPFFSFDLDGVIGTPLLGLDWTLSRKLTDDEIGEVRRVDRAISGLPGRVSLKFKDLSQQLRYFGRRPMPGAHAGIAEVYKHRNLIIITGRSHLARKIVQAWLKRYQLDKYILDVFANYTDQSTRKYKLHLLRQFEINEHADDDGGIVYYLAKCGVSHVYLRDWRRNTGLPYPSNVVRFTHISEIARDIESRARQQAL